MENINLLIKAVRILEDLKRCGSFYCSAIELDNYIENGIDGEEFEERIDNLLKEIDEYTSTPK